MQKSKLQVKIKNWPSKKILECIQKLPKNPGIPLKNYQKTGKIPVIDQGQDFIGGYTDDETLVYTNNLPVVIFGDHTRAIKFVDFPFAVGADGTKVLKPKDFLDTKYFYFALLSLNIESRGYARHFRILKEKEIPLPTIGEQRKIVEKIEKLFAKIDEAQKLREESKKSASALLQSALNEIFSPSAGSGQVAKSQKWEEKELGNICEKTKLVQPKEISKDDFSYIDITSVGDAVGVDVVRARVMPVKNAPSRARKLVKEGDTIFATTRPYLKRIAFISKELNKSIASTGFCVLRPKPEIADSSYVFHIVNSDNFVSKIISLQRGASYPAVSDKDILNQKILLPPIAEQKKIVAYLDSLSEKVRALQKFQNETEKDLANLKQSILQKSFSGKL